MNKMEIAAELGRFEGELSTTEGTLREWERQFNSAKGNRTAGAAALLIGIIGVLFFSSLWPLWGFLGLIGVLTLFTAIAKQSKAKRNMKVAEERIAYLRATIAERRAQLAIP